MTTTQQPAPSLNPALRQSAPSDSARALALIERGRTHMQTNLDSSWHYIRQAIRIGKRLPNKRILTKAYNALATTYVVTGESKKGLAILRQAERLSRLYPFDSIRLEVLVRTIQAHRIQGDYRQALQRGLTLNDDLEKHPAQKAAILFSLYTELALIHQHLAIDSLVLPYYQKAYRFAVSRQDKKLTMAAAGNLGEYYIGSQSFDKAERYLKTTLALSQQLHLDHSSAETFRNLGEIKRNQQQHQAAIDYYKQALAIHQRIGAKEFVGYTYLQLAQSYGALNRLPQALACLEKSITLFKAIQSAHYLHQALLVKVKLQQQQGRYKQALLTMNQAYVLGDSLTGLEKQKAIAQIKTQFDSERKQAQIATLKQDLTLQQKARQTMQLQLTLTRHQRTFFIVVSVLLLIFAGLIYLNFSRLQHAQHLLRQQKQEIQLQADQLEELNKTKDQLFSIISHDLRSPLVGLKQDIRHLLTNVEKGENVTLSGLSGLDQKTDNLLALLMTLFDWAYMQFNGFQTKLEAVNLSDAIAQASSYFADRIQQKQLTVIQQVGSDIIVQADRNQLAIILRNLLDNAIKFTPMQGYVRILAIDKTETVDLQIRDTGVGMPSAMLDTLFMQPEVRQGTQGEIGTGLGLKIIRELLSKQKGAVTIDSQLNRGTVIRVCLQKPDHAHQD